VEFLTAFCQTLYTYLFSLIGIDFSNYAGELPEQFVNMYAYVDKFFQILVIFLFLYLIFNFLFFLFSLGGIRRK
jgi:hypothetical protein